MAVDIEKIKKMVDKISRLTVLELSKLVKALKDRFGLSTSVRVRRSAAKVGETEAVSEEPPDIPSNEVGETEAVSEEPPDIPSNEVGETEAVSEEPNEAEEASTKPEEESNIEKPNAEDEVVDDPIDEQETAAVSEEPNEAEEASTKPEEESKPFPDPLSVKVPVDDPVDDPVYKPVYGPVYKPEGEDYDLVYAWRYSGDKRYAKIGISTNHLLQTRMPGTYHPTDDPVLIGIFRCESRQKAELVEHHILSGLKRTRSGHEWVEIDETFNEMIDERFISDPDELFEIFGTRVKIANLRNP